MSTTESDLPSAEADGDGALDAVLPDDDFDDALDAALTEADVELDLDARDEDVGDLDDDADTTDVVADAHDVADDSVGEETTAADASDDHVASAPGDNIADDDGTARHGIRPAVQDEDADGDDFELPVIVPATPDGEDDGDDHSVAVQAGVAGVAVARAVARQRPDVVGPADDASSDRHVAAPDPADANATPDARAPAVVPGAEPELDDDEDVSDDILEELRRADIDGPVVDLEPQDDTATARRRPRRSVDYDPAPMPIPAQVPRVLGRKPRVRKVTRVVRHVDPWSVFKIAFVANVVLYIIALTASVLLWNVAHATGTVDNVERFFESFGWESFEFNGGEIYHAGWIAGLFLVIGLTGLAVLMATLFNLITDLVGGMRFTVLEEEVVETRVSPIRRFVVRRPEPEVPARLSDESGAMIREAVVDDTGANQRPSR